MFLLQTVAELNCTPESRLTITADCKHPSHLQLPPWGENQNANQKHGYCWGQHHWKITKSPAELPHLSNLRLWQT